MKKLLLGTFIFTSTMNVHAEIPQDKKYHLGGGVAMGTVFTLVTEDWRKSMAACTTVGLAKEAYDEYSYGGWDWEDAGYTFGGCVIGTVLGETGLYLSQDKEMFTVGYKGTF